MMRLVALVLFVASRALADEGPAAAQPNWGDRLWSNTSPIGLTFNAELGFIGVTSHHIQLSRTGSDVDYLSDGAQNTLFPFTRFSTDIRFLERHTLVLLYQPLELGTSNVLRRSLTIDGEVFAAATPVDFFYGFSFWRLSYLYNFLWARPGQELAVGLSLQIRNARITFASRDGTQFRTNQNIGPVPVVKVRGRYTFRNGLWLGTEIDGFYAASPGFNGSDSQFTGAILDASLRGGVELTPVVDVFLNARTILGGAIGAEKKPKPPSDGYTSNWLYTVSLSIGVSLKVLAAR